MSVLLNLSTQHLFWQGKDPEPIEQHHRPALLAWPQDPDEDIQTAHDRLAGLVADAGKDSVEDNPLTKAHDVLDPLEYTSFWDFGRKREVIPVVGKRSYWIPEISDDLFFRHGFYTAEHDIPYRERALADLCAEKDWWLFDTKGKPAKLSVLTYDIETTQYEEGKKDVPIDMIGYSDFDVQYEASKDLETEELDFSFRDLPNDWADREVIQHEARNVDEELDMLHDFTKDVAVKHDIIAGHNVLGFDNKQIHERMRDMLKRDGKDANLSPDMRSWFEEFTRDFSRLDRSFHFGTSSDIAVWHPVTLDTFHAARKFYFFHDDFTLKGLAPWLGVHVEDREYMDAKDMGLDARTRTYNKHDVQEQLGITQALIAQALPLAFTTNLPLDELLTGGNTKMWDHMAFLRARRARKIMPATCRAMQVCRTAQRLIPGEPNPSREEVARAARDLGPNEAQTSRYKEFVRVAKQGPEMPFWLEHPSVMADPDPSANDPTGYDIVGGLTLKPDSDLQSHFIPWYHVVEADVGAMYPTILKARNLTADTVQPAKTDEEPDAWLWLDRLDHRFAESGKYHVRRANDEETFTGGRGWMVGIKKDPEEGMVNKAMTGILRTIQKVKDERAEAKAKGAPADEVRIHDMTYASLKAARNAGTHGILVAVNVSCRQFNMWGGAAITTIGQQILHDTQKGFEERGRRVVYGDSIVGDRCIVVKDPEGNIRVEPVARLFDRIGSRLQRRQGKEVKDGDGWLAWSGDPSDGSGHWRPIRQWIRHDTQKSIVRVRQTDGETVCTEDHSIMARTKDGIVAMRPSEIQDAELVRIPVPNESIQEPLDLWPLFNEVAGDLGAMLGTDGRRNVDDLPERIGADGEWMWCRNSISAGAIGQPRARRLFIPGSKASRALARSLGRMLSEGSVRWGRRTGISIAQADKGWLNKARDDLQSIFEGCKMGIIRSARGTRTIRLIDGTTTMYEDHTFKLQVSNQTAAAFFYALCGKGSDGKRIPPFVFTWPMEEKKEFLRTLVEGDGSHKWGDRYTERFQQEHFQYTTKSLELASGLSVLLQQLEIDHNLRYDAKKQAHVIKTRRTKRHLNTNVTPEPIVHAHVYDLDVEGTRTFVDAYGSILLHNTDGIYLACSKSMGNLPHMAAALDADVEPDEKAWITLPDEAKEAIEAMNVHWQKELDYPGFELEMEQSDAMVFIVHKNYLKFQTKGDQVVMDTKGNNFKGSDKAPIARILLEEIMRHALRDVASWEDEEDARERMKTAIKRHTTELMKHYDAKTAATEDLILRQQVRPIKSYKPNPDGSASAFAVRTVALEQLLGEQFTAGRKMKFIVCKRPLPFYEQQEAQKWGTDRLERLGLRYNGKKPGKSGIKPMEYMWPIDLVEPHMTDFDWYKDTVAAYVKGAFGFSSLELASQRDLSSWF